LIFEFVTRNQRNAAQKLLGAGFTDRRKKWATSVPRMSGHLSQSN
jgi:hypothetical protein